MSEPDSKQVVGAQYKNLGGWGSQILLLTLCPRSLKLSNTWQTAVGAQGPGSQREMEIPSADPETSGRVNCSVSNKGKTSTFRLVRAMFTFGDSTRDRCRKQRMPESVQGRRNPKTGRLEPLQYTDCGGNHTQSIGLNSSRGSVFNSSIPEESEPGRTIFIQVATVHSAGEIQ